MTYMLLLNCALKLVEEIILYIGKKVGLGTYQYPGTTVR